ncbi:PLP-dependent aminotransferase family protein [Kiloniella majae]|uniref:aminotransferase-like domain-containing protein n=2 Tax=Kiloniella majae TaxID=1938558 RepID=UPI001302B8EA|nr:PLP-dependent aminotransferase family protein [Kiloniella majae]
MEAMWKPELNPETKTKYLAIVDAISKAIQKGDLLAGERLPTHRDLAWELKLNVSTVSQAYKEATKRHLIGGEVGRGTYVLATSREAELFALKDSGKDSVANGSFDLSTNIPAVHPDDRNAQNLLFEALERGAGTQAFSYHSSDLLMRTRFAASQWLSWRGYEVKPSDIVPCAGGQQALLASLLALCEPGDKVLVEKFTFPGMKAVARQLRLKLVGIECDEDGINPEGLEKALITSGAKILVLNPNLNNPTGFTTSEQRCSDIVKIIKRHDIVVIEDDVYGPLSGNRPLSVHLPDHAVLISSLSKSVAPGLRYGFVSGCQRLIGPIDAEVHATNWAMSPFIVELANLWILEGRAFARADWQRHEVEARWSLAKSRFKKMGAVNWEKTPCPHLWLAVSGTANDAANKLHDAGIDVVSGELFATTPQPTHHIRICLTAPESRSLLSQAIDKVIECNVLSSSLRSI